MPTTAETVITQMQLDATKYVAGSKQVIAANKAMNTTGAQLVKQYQAVQQALGAINMGTGNTFNFGGGGGGLGGGGAAMFGRMYIGLRIIREVTHALEELGHKFVEVSIDAMNEYASFNTLELSFEGIYRSGDKAAKMMEYLRSVAETSAFHFRDLADAARSISVAGLDVGRFLPVVQGFALAMGKIDSAGLQDFVSILRRLQGGNTGVALGPRGIGRYGVSRNELEANGAKFDQRGHFLGSINDAFDAIEKVFNNRIRGIADKVTQSSEVVLSDFHDMIQQATIDFGAGVAENMIGPIKELTKAGNDLRQSGIFKDIAETLYGILDLGGEVGGSDQMEDTLIDIGGYIVSIMEFVKLNYLELVDILGWVKVAARWTEAIATVGASEVGRQIFGSGDDPVTNLDWSQKAGDDWRAHAEGMRDLDRARRKKHPERYGAPGAPEGNAIPGVDDDAEPEDKSADAHRKHLDELKAIREHARRIDKTLSDAKSTSMGGGDIGRLGVTPVEMSSYRHGGTNSVGGVMASAGQQIDQMVTRMMQQAISNALRQGYVTGGAR